MIKPSKKWFAYLAVLGACVFTTGAVNSQADDIYDDSNVSILTAVDRYMATSTEANTVDMKAFELCFGSTLKEEVAPTSISAYMDEDIATGLSQEDEEETTEETTEVTTEDTQEEETTEAPQEEETPYVPLANCQYPEYADKAVVTASSTVNIRSQANTNCSVVGWAGAGQVVTVKSKGSEWSKISMNGTEGYIKNEFLAYADDAAAYVQNNSDTIAIINSGSLRLRTEASTNSVCLAYLPAAGSYLVLSEEGDWTKIQVSDSLTGYVHNDYITITKGKPNNYAAILVQQQPTGGDTSDDTSDTTTDNTNVDNPTDIPTGGSGITSCTGQDIANYAVQFVGNPYVYGGTSLTNGADCSGFVMRVYADHGISLTRTAYYQASDGIEVSISQLVPGDLIIFDYGTGTIQHVGIYIGNNQYVHAANSSLGIVISTLNTSSVYTCRRIIY